MELRKNRLIFKFHGQFLQDEKMHKLALSHCIRGVMIANDKPFNHWNPVRKPASSGYDM